MCHVISGCTHAESKCLYHLYSETIQGKIRAETMSFWNWKLTTSTKMKRWPIWKRKKCLVGVFLSDLYIFLVYVGEQMMIHIHWIYTSYCVFYGIVWLDERKYFHCTIIVQVTHLAIFLLNCFIVFQQIKKLAKS